VEPDPVEQAVGKRRVQQIEQLPEGRRKAMEAERSEVMAELGQVEEVVARLTDLRSRAADRRDSVSSLREEVASLDPAALGRPADTMAAQDGLVAEPEEPLL